MSRQGDQHHREVTGNMEHAQAILALLTLEQSCGFITDGVDAHELGFAPALVS